MRAIAMKVRRNIPAAFVADVHVSELRKFTRVELLYRRRFGVKIQRIHTDGTAGS